MTKSDQNATGKALDICIVTPTYNRLALLRKLHQSLLSQDDLEFTWIIVDDASEDRTKEWARKVATEAPFPIIILSNSHNFGKGRSLNRAFESQSSDLAIIVDSDDQLLPNAISSIRSRLHQIANLEEIGALFFSYVDVHGRTLGNPPNGRTVLTTRAAMDSEYGKYDGCVAYTSTAMKKYRYPEFANENYIAPTVIQLLMSPPLKMLFCNNTVGIAHYQADGLTKTGRHLRLKNPKGMMLYSTLNAEKGHGWLFKLKYRVTYWAYATSIKPSPNLESYSKPNYHRIERIAGRMLGRYWRYKARSNITS